MSIKKLIISRIADKINVDKNKVYFDHSCFTDKSFLSTGGLKVFEGYGNNKQSIKEDNATVGEIYKKSIKTRKASKKPKLTKFREQEKFF